VSRPAGWKSCSWATTATTGPVERIPALMAALGDKGINLTYTDRLDDLNPATLARYDGLLIYANWDSIPAPQEKALLDYVASGKGLIPVHCASYCFRNSAEYVKLVGGQFWRHKMDTVRATVTDAAHPAVAGLQPFGAYDETYLHEKLGADNHVLMTREIKADQAADKPNQKTEPYTWTRTHGAGRVFYTPTATTNGPGNSRASTPCSNGASCGQWATG
jgi:type 1 glutamine amidotransferase